MTLILGSTTLPSPPVATTATLLPVATVAMGCTIAFMRLFVDGAQKTVQLSSCKRQDGSVITIEGGAVNVAGRFYPNSIGQTTTCTISGGTITLVKQGSSTASSKFASF